MVNITSFIYNLTDLIDAVGSHLIPSLADMVTNMVPLVITLITIGVVVAFYKQIANFLGGLFTRILGMMHLGGK